MNPTACRIAPPRRAAKSFAISCSALNSRSVRKATPSDEQQQGQTKEQRDHTHRKPEGRDVLIAAGRKHAYQEVCPEPAEPGEEAGYRYEMRTTNQERALPTSDVPGTALTPGQYLVAVIDQVPSPPPTGGAILTQVVAFFVCPGGLGIGSPGCTFAP